MAKVGEMLGLAKVKAQQAVRYTQMKTREAIVLTKSSTKEATVFATETRAGVTGSTAAASAALGTATGGFVGSVTGAIAGGAVGVAAGAAVGVIPAFFTFGASIPILAVMGLCAGVTTGGTVGAAGGAATGGTAGAAGGAAVGFVGFTYREEIKDTAHGSWTKVRTSAARAKATVHNSAAQLVNSVKTFVDTTNERAWAALDFTKAKITNAVDFTKAKVAESIELAKTKVNCAACYTRECTSKTLAFTKDKTQGMTNSVKTKLRWGSTGGTL